MPETNESGANETGNAYADPYYMANSDHNSSNQQLGIIIFNGENYLNWTRSIRMALGSRNKLGYIDGKLKMPNPGHADYRKWYRNDNAVRGWILASTTTNLDKSLIYLETSKELWDEVKERYG
uniref:Retrotransposon Copia-like N-terminal domain-containing protein n=1 Tax=Chenopodium quinoa TaxID=63459 RepID=A0A803LBA2_CHEQI